MLMDSECLSPPRGENLIGKCIKAGGGCSEWSEVAHTQQKGPDHSPSAHVANLPFPPSPDPASPISVEQAWERSRGRLEEHPGQLPRSQGDYKNQI